MWLKYIFSILLAATIANCLEAKSFFVSTEGKNYNLGSIHEPWKDLNYAIKNISPGDTIYIRRGIYRSKQFFDGKIGAQSGNKDNPIVITNFKNEEVKFYGSLDFNDVDLWKVIGNDLWATDSPSVVSYDVGTIWRDEKAAQRKTSRNDLREEWDFWFDTHNQRIVVKSNENPAEISNTLEIPVGEAFQHVFTLKNLHHITIDGLIIKYANTHGLQMTDVHNITIRNCSVSHGGGPWIWEDEPVRYGNGIELWCNGHDILIENCKVSNFFDTGITHQGDNGEQYNITIRNNHLFNVKCGIEHWGTQTIKISNILYENNLIENTGDNWANNLQNVWGAIRLMRHHPNAKGAHIENTGKVQNFVVRNNLIKQCGSRIGGQFEMVSPFYEHPSIRLIGGPYIIENNIIENGKSVGIYATHEFHGEIKNNTIKNCKWEGINLSEDSKSAILENNLIKNCNSENNRIK